jgi:hypothetical protein
MTSRASSPLLVYALLVGLCTSVAFETHGQTAKRRVVRFASEDRTVQAQVLNEPGHIVALSDRDYFWCIGQRLMITQGGYSGDLLDGAYVAYHPNGQLMTKGCLSNGLRTGTWLEWNEQGRLLQSTNWKGGLKHGPALAMDSAGGKPAEQHYRRGKLIAPKQEEEEDGEDKVAPSDSTRDRNLRVTKKEKSPKEEKGGNVSKRLRARQEQNKGTKQVVVRKREKDKSREKGQPMHPVTP